MGTLSGAGWTEPLRSVSPRDRDASVSSRAPWREDLSRARSLSLSLFLDSAASSAQRIGDRVDPKVADIIPVNANREAASRGIVHPLVKEQTKEMRRAR